MIHINFTPNPSAPRQIVDIVTKEIKSTGADTAKAYTESLLRQQVDSTFTKMPKKAPATIKEYQKHNWNTEDFFFRTGESAKLVVKETPTGFKLQPARPEILALNYDRAPFMEITQELNNKIVNDIAKKLRERLK